MRKNTEHLSLSINFKRNKLCKIMRVNRETLIARKTWIHGKVEDRITRKIRTITSVQFYIG